MDTDVLDMPAPEIVTHADDETNLAPHGRDGDGNPLAPYGLKVDGTPRKSAAGRQAGDGRGILGGGGRHGGSRAGRRPRKRAAKGAAKATAPRPTRAKPPAKVDYVKLLSGAVATAGGGVQFLSRWISPDKPKWARARELMAADGAALTLHAVPIGTALADVVAQEPAVVAWLERASNVSPWVRVGAACLPLLAQLGANHEIVNPGTLGAIPREELLAWAEQVLAQAGYTVQAPSEAAPTPDAHAA